jgi:heme o synthase
LLNNNQQNLTEDYGSLILKYFSLTKPRIIVLLSLTGVIAYLLPNPIDITPLSIIGFIFMGYTTSGGAMAINNYIDRDIDSIMNRTKNRPSVNEINPAWKIIVFGSSLILIGLAIGYFVFNFYTFLILLFAILFYLFGYSLFLKRNSILSTIIGGIISPAPVWVGYSAALGVVPLEGWLLGLIVFFWTPSHTWAMSAKNLDDYTNAKIPMLPVLYGMKTTGLATLIGGIITIIFGYFVYISYYFSETILGYTFLTISGIVTLYFLYTLVDFWLRPSVKTATITFRYGHTLWLVAIFIAVLIYNYN